MHLLQLCPRVPFPLHDGGAIAMYEVARGLSQLGHRVTVLAINTPKHHQPADVLDHLGPLVRLVTVDVNTDLSVWRALRNLVFSGLPYNVERFINGKIFGKLTKIISEDKIDIIQFEGTFVAPYLHHLDLERLGLEGTDEGNKLQIPFVLRAHNIEHTIWQMLAARAANPLKKIYLKNMAVRLARFERAELPRFDAVVAITAPDAGRLRALGCPEPVAFIAAGVDLTRFQPDAGIVPKPKTLFLLGSLNWLPNQEGLAWLLREVWPLAHAEMPDLTLHVAGTGAPATLLTAPPAGVVMHGFVASAPDFMRQFDLMLVPLLSGGGMRVKIIEGLALGKVILSTALGAEGIAVQDGRDIVLRDSAAEWLAAIRAWHRAELPVAAISAAAVRTAAELYDTRQVARRFEELYARLLPASIVPAPKIPAAPLR